MIPNGNRSFPCGFNPRTPCGVRLPLWPKDSISRLFQSTHSLWSATEYTERINEMLNVSIHALLVECDACWTAPGICSSGFNPRTPCGVRPGLSHPTPGNRMFQSTHSLWSATVLFQHAKIKVLRGFNPRTPCGVRPGTWCGKSRKPGFQSTHSLWSATAPDLIHCYSTEQIILCANLPKKTVIARLLFLSIYLSIFYSQCITPIADLPGNSCELEVGAQAMFNSL